MTHHPRSTPFPARAARAALALPAALGLAMAGCSSPGNGAGDAGAGEARVAVEVTFPEARSDAALDGRLILVLSQRMEGDPIRHVTDGAGAQPVFGVDVEDWAPGQPAAFTDTVFGFPVARLGDLPAGTYRAQALLNRYETFTRSDGHTVKLPPDRGEGQQWASKPGNLYSDVVEFTVADGGANRLVLSLDHEIEALPDPATLETEWVKYVRVRSDRAVGPGEARGGQDAPLTEPHQARLGARPGVTPIVLAQEELALPIRESGQVLPPERLVSLGQRPGRVAR